MIQESLNGMHWTSLKTITFWLPFLLFWASRYCRIWQLLIWRLHCRWNLSRYCTRFNGKLLWQVYVDTGGERDLSEISKWRTDIMVKLPCFKLKSLSLFLNNRPRWYFLILSWHDWWQSLDLITYWCKMDWKAGLVQRFFLALENTCKRRASKKHYRQSSFHLFLLGLETYSVLYLQAFNTLNKLPNLQTLTHPPCTIIHCNLG